jgi:hypothetical protein
MEASWRTCSSFIFILPCVLPFDDGNIWAESSAESGPYCLSVPKIQLYARLRQYTYKMELGTRLPR